MYHLLRFLSWFVSFFPLKFWHFISGNLTRFIFLFLPGKRKNIYENYKHILSVKSTGKPSNADIKKTMSENFYNYGKFCAEFLYINKLMKKTECIPKMRDKGFETIKQALDNGKGLIIATLHFSNWDVGGIILSRNIASFSKTWAIVDDLGGGYSRFVQEQRIKYGMNVILPDKNLRDAYKALKNNDVLCVLADRPLPQDDKTGVLIDFLGKKAYVASAAARLALKYGSKIILGYGIRENDWFYDVTSDIIQYDLSGDYEKDVQIVTQAIFKEAEKIILQYPEQWYCFKKMWIE
jgi:KDO2-lipid IV(A) lauroyltransferase